MAAYDSRNLHLVELNDANLTIYIPPWMCNQVEAGVYDELDNTLLRYMDDQEAVLLAYNSVQITSKQALLASYLPYLAIEARANLLLFKPIPGKILVGRVHRLSSGLLGLLVLGGINAMIPAAQMPKGFKYDAKNVCWVPDGDYSRAILMGDFVACNVLSIPVMDPDDEELLFNLDATLLHPDAGLCAKQTDLQQQKRAHLAVTMAAAKPVNGVTESADKKEHRKKKKDKQHKEQKHRSKDRESASKNRKRKQDDADEQQASKKRKHSSSKQQAQQQQPVSNGISTPPPAAASEPVTPVADRSKSHKKHKSRDSSAKHSSKKHRSSSSSSKKHSKDHKQKEAEGW